MSQEYLNTEDLYCYVAFIYGKSSEPLRVIAKDCDALYFNFKDLCRHLKIINNHIFMEVLKNKPDIKIVSAHFPVYIDPMALEIKDFVDVVTAMRMVKYTSEQSELSIEEAEAWYRFMDLYLSLQLRKVRGCGPVNVLFHIR